MSFRRLRHSGALGTCQEVDSGGGAVDQARHQRSGALSTSPAKSPGLFQRVKAKIQGMVRSASTQSFSNSIVIDLPSPKDSTTSHAAGDAGDRLGRSVGDVTTEKSGFAEAMRNRFLRSSTSSLATEAPVNNKAKPKGHEADAGPDGLQLSGDVVKESFFTTSSALKLPNVKASRAASVESDTTSPNTTAAHNAAVFSPCATSIQSQSSTARSEAWRDEDVLGLASAGSGVLQEPFSPSSSGRPSPHYGGQNGITTAPASDALSADVQEQQGAAHNSCRSRSSSNNGGSMNRSYNQNVIVTSPQLPEAMRRVQWSLEDYSITRRIFKGSVSNVYKANCLHSDYPVALKVYFASRVPENIVHMLKREVELHAGLAHRHVVHLYGAFMDGERLVLVQEWAARGDLLTVTSQLGGRIPEAQAARAVVAPFLDALAYLHAKGICHRDVKPENILVDASGRILLADFGVAINIAQERAVTRAGTAGYMAPEVERCPLKTHANENKDQPGLAYSTAVDIYALGVMLYELLVGFTPVVAPVRRAAQHVAQPPAVVGPIASAAGSRGEIAAAAGSVSDFVTAEMSPATLHFPSSVSAPARAFITWALQADPRDRPTAKQLLLHPWIQTHLRA